MVAFKIFIAFIVIFIPKIAETRFFWRRSMYEVGITGTVACQYPRSGNRFSVYISEKPNTKKEYRPIAKSSGIFWQRFHLHTVFGQWRTLKHLYVKFLFQCSRRPSRCMQMIIKPIPPHMIYRRGGATKFLNLGTFDVTGKSSLKGTCLKTTRF